MNKYQSQINKAKSINVLKKIASHIGVKLGNTKDISKAKTKLTKALVKEQTQIKRDYKNNITVRMLNKARKELNSVEDGFRYLNKVLRSGTGEYQSLYELNMVLNTFKNVKGNITLKDINNMGKKLHYNDGQFLDVINMKLAKFDLNTYSDLLKFYGFTDKEIKDLARKFNKANIKRKDHFLKIINEYAKGKNKYQAMNEDIDHTLARENFKGEFDMRIIGGVNSDGKFIDEL